MSNSYYVHLLMLDKSRTVVANIRLQEYGIYDEAVDGAHAGTDAIRNERDRRPNICKLVDIIEYTNRSKLKKVIGVYTAEGACKLNLEV